MTTRPLHGMFSAVPGRYDLVNRLLTWGLDQSWRRRAVRRIVEGRPRRVLDLGSGTGDLALPLAGAGGVQQVVAADFAAAMLGVAHEKALGRGLRERIFLTCADAAALPFASGSFDAVGIAFAFRNITYRNPLTGRALGELRRILRVGGRLTIVETSQPDRPLLRAAYHAYLGAAVGPLGGLISGQAGAYRYLSVSARRYYRAEEVSALLESAGFEVAVCEPLLFGAAAIHVATRPPD